MAKSFLDKMREEREKSQGAASSSSANKNDGTVLGAMRSARQGYLQSVEDRKKAEEAQREANARSYLDVYNNLTYLRNTHINDINQNMVDQGLQPIYTDNDFYKPENGELSPAAAKGYTYDDKTRSLTPNFSFSEEADWRKSVADQKLEESRAKLEEAKANWSRAEEALPWNYSTLDDETRAQWDDAAKSAEDAKRIYDRYNRQSIIREQESNAWATAYDKAVYDDLVSSGAEPLFNELYNLDYSSQGIKAGGIANAFAGGDSYNPISANLDAENRKRETEIRQELLKRGYSAEQIGRYYGAYKRYQNKTEQERVAGEVRGIVGDINENPAQAVFGGLGMSAASVASAPLRGLTSLLGMALDDGAQYSPYNMLSTVSNATHQQVEQNINDMWMGEDEARKNGVTKALATVSNWIYSAGTSTAESLLTMTLGGGPVGGGFLMGLGAGTEEYQNALDRGLSKGQALATGLAAGIFEEVFETLSLENLSAFKAQGKHFLTNLAKQMFVEGSEEFFTDIANEMYDVLANGELSKFDAYVRQQMAEGVSEEEAKAKYAKDFSKQLGESFIVGALSGGFGGGNMAIQSQMQNREQNAAIGQNLRETAESLNMSERQVAQPLLDNLSQNNFFTGERSNARAMIDERLSDYAPTEEERKNAPKVSDRQQKREDRRKGAAISAAISEMSEADRKSIREDLIAQGYSPVTATYLSQNIQQYLEGRMDKSDAEKLLKKSGVREVLDNFADRQNDMTTAEGRRASAAQGYRTVTAVASTLRSQLDDAKKTMEKSIQKKLTTEEVEKRVDENKGISPVRVDSITDGKVTLAMKDGTKVELTDSTKFASKDVATKFIGATSLGFDATTTNKIINAVDMQSETSVGEQLIGLDEAVRYGRMGLQPSTTGMATVLTDGQRQFAYAEGQRLRAEDVKARQTTLNETYKKMQTRIQERTVLMGGQKGTVKYVGTSLEGKTERQVASMAALTHLAKNVTKNDVVIFESKVGDDGKTRVFSADVMDRNGFREGDAAPNGFYEKGTIYIDLNAGEHGEGAILWTAAHEMTHWMKDYAREKYEELADYLVKTYTDSTVEDLIRSQKDKAKRNGNELSDEEAFDEVVADAMSLMLTDTNAMEKIEKLRVENPSLWEKIKAAFQKIFNAVKRAYKGLDPETQEAQMLKEMMEPLEKLSDLFAEGIVEAGRNYEAMQTERTGIAVDTATNTPVVLSVRTLLDEKQRKAAEDNLAKIYPELSREDIRKWLDAETSLASIILSPENVEYLDYTPDDNEKAVKKNSDYPQGTVDFSNICVKRRALVEIMNKIYEMYPNQVFTPEDLSDILSIVIKNGIKNPCVFCYVEDRRQLDSVVADLFIRSLEAYRRGEKSVDGVKEFNAGQLAAFKKVQGISYTPTIAELVTPQGRTELQKKSPEMVAAWTRYNNARGMQSVRVLLPEAEYKREIRRYNQRTINSKNSRGGLRIYSFSDFEMFHLIDLVQVLTDCSEKGLFAQGYTKVNEYARLAANTGLKLNRSLIPKGRLGYHLDADGNVVLDFDTREGIDVNSKDFFDNKDNPNIGNIVIGVNYEHIRAAMLSDMIDQIIPFHTGQSQEVLKRKGVDGWVNYKDSQTDKVKNEKGVWVTAEKQINIYTDVIQALEKAGETVTKRSFTEKYLAVCAERDMMPRFAEFLDRDEDGKYVYTEGYYKLLVDFKTFAHDEAGTYLPQGQITPNFDMEYISSILQSYADVKMKEDDDFRKKLPGVVKEISDKVVQNDGVKRSYRGVHADTHDQSLLDEAEALEKQGVSSEDIRKQTGWFRGMDDEWRYEIDDSKMTVRTENIPTDGSAVSLGKLINHDELFAAYPELRNIRVDFTDLGSALGIFYPSSFGISLSEDLIYSPNRDKDGYREMGYGDAEVAEALERNDREFKDTLIHEIQHAIQDIEGFAPGTNISTADGSAPITKDVRKVAKLIRDFEKNLYKKYGTNFYVDMTEAGAWYEADVYEFWGRIEGIERKADNGEYKTSDEIKKDFRKIVDSYIDLLKKMKAAKSDASKYDSLTAYRKYQNTAGEIESRDVSSRLDLSPEERKKKRPDIDREDVLFATKFSTRNGRELAPTFYSQLGRAVDNMKMDKIGASSVISYLKGRGVKDEEIKWSGIRTFLEGKKSVTREELQQFLKENEIRIETRVRDLTYDSNIYDSWNQARIATTRKAWDKIETDGLNIEDGSLEVEDADEGGFVAYGTDSNGNRIEILKYNPEKTAVKWAGYKLDGGENYREYEYILPGSEYTNNAMHTHWGDKGVIAHVRVQDFDTEDGDRVLFVEEIQSDWHNAGAKTGWEWKKPDEKDFEVRIESTGIRDKAVLYVNGNRTDISETLINSWDSHGEAWKQSKKNVLIRQYLLDNQDRTVDAPYAGEADSYVPFVLKNLLREAAENGYDYIGWTTAQQQADRWSDSYMEGYRIEYDQDIPKFLKKYGKQWGAIVGDIEINAPSSSAAFDSDIEQHLYDRMNFAIESFLALYDFENDVDGLFGQSVSEEAMRDWDEKRSRLHHEAVSAATDFAEAVSAAVGIRGYLDIDDTVSTFAESIDASSRDLAEEEMRDWGDSQIEQARDNNGASDTTAVHGMTITDAMRDSVLYEGQPKFSSRNTDGTDARSLLASALESTAQTEREKTLLAGYQRQVEDLNADQARLADLRKKIADFSRLKGKARDQAVREFAANDRVPSVDTIRSYLENYREGLTGRSAGELAEQAEGLREAVVNYIIDQSPENFDAVFNSLYPAMQQESREEREILSEENDDMKDLYEAARGSRIYLEPSIFRQVASNFGGPRAFRQRLFGHGIIVSTDRKKKYIGLDVLYSDLKEEGYGVTGNSTDPTEQIREILAAKDKRVSVETKVVGREKTQEQVDREAARWTNEVIEAIYEQSDIMTILGTNATKTIIAQMKDEATKLANRINIADKRLLRLESTAPIKNVLAAEKKKAADRARAQGKKAQADALTLQEMRLIREAGEEYNKLERKLQRKDKSIERLEADIKRRQEARQTDIDRRKSTDLRHRIAKIRSDFVEKIGKDKGVPPALVDGVIDVCNMIDPTGENQNSQAAQKYRNVRQSLLELKAAYESIRTNDKIDADFKSEYSQELADRIALLADAIGNKPLREMSRDQLEDVYDALVEIRHTLMTAKKQIGIEYAITNYQAGMSFVKTMQNVIAKKLNRGLTGANGPEAWVRNWLTNPLRAVHEMTGYDEDSQLYKLFDGLAEGLRKGQYWEMTARKTLEPFQTGKNRKLFEEASQKPFDFGLTDLDGNPLKISKMQAMQILLTYERETNNANRAHLANTIIIPDVTYIAKGQYSKALDNAQKMAALDEGVISKLREGLSSDFDLAFMDAAREVFKMSADAVNETSLVLKGRAIATEKSYIPYEVFGDVLNNEFENVAYDISIANMGMTKSVQKNSTASLVMRGLDTVMDKHLGDTAKYYGLSIPVRNFTKAYNTKLTSVDSVENNNVTSAKNAIRDAWGTKGMKLIEQAVADVQGSRRGDTIPIIGKLRSNLVQATLASNVSVWIKQAASYPTAGSILSQRALAKGLAYLGTDLKPKARKKLWDEIDEHTASHYIRRQGLSIQELAEFSQSKGIGKKLSKFGGHINPMNWIQSMDVRTTAALWVACKAEVKQQGIEVGSEAYWDAVTELYDKVIEETQPMYDPIHRAEITKNKAQSFILFQTQPIQNSGILREATMKLNDARKEYGIKSEEAKEAGKGFAKAVISQLASHAVFALMTLVGSGLVLHKMGPYRDDEEEVTAGSVSGAVLKNILKAYTGAVFPVVGNYVVEAIDKLISKNNYDVVSDMTLEAINSTVTTLQRVQKKMEDGSLTVTDVTKAVTDIAKYLGIPAANAYNIVNGIISYANDIKQGKLFGSDENVTTAIRNARIYNALAVKDTEALDELKKEFKTSDEWHKAIQTIVKDRENDQLVAAAVARQTSDLSGYEDILKEIHDEGVYTWDDITAAADSVVKSLQSGIKDARKNKENGWDDEYEKKVKSLTDKGFSREFIEAQIGEVEVKEIDDWTEEPEPEDTVTEITYGKAEIAAATQTNDAKALNAVVKTLTDKYRAAGKDNPAKEAQGDVKEVLYDQFLDGTIDDAQARKLLSSHANIKGNDLYWLMREWAYKKQHGKSASYSKYNEFDSAVQSLSAQETKRQMSIYLDHGVTAKSLADRVSSVWKQAYIDADEARKKQIYDFVIPIYDALGFDRRKTIKSSWK